MKKRLFLFWGPSISVTLIRLKAQGEMVFLETNDIYMAGDVKETREYDGLGDYVTAYYRDVWFIGCEEPKRFASMEKEDLVLEEFRTLKELL